MDHLVWYSEVAGLYLLMSLIIATGVGRVLRQASQPDDSGVEYRPLVSKRPASRTERPIGRNIVFNP
jgi:hypothetical protein